VLEKKMLDLMDLTTKSKFAACFFYRKCSMVHIHTTVQQSSTFNMRGMMCSNCCESLHTSPI
jgi:hypothetical protein